MPVTTRVSGQSASALRPLSVSSLSSVCSPAVDVAASTARGIQVSHTPAAVDDATATVGAYLAISALRQFYRAEQNVRNGRWKAGLEPASDPEGRTVGIIGMGGIGSALARRLLAFDMKIIYYNRNPIQPPPNFPCTYVPNLDDLLAQSDVISLNLPLNEKTKGSFGREQFKKMKQGSVLVNTARGAVVDEEAFIEALESGKVRRARSCGWEMGADDSCLRPVSTSTPMSRTSTPVCSNSTTSPSCRTWVPRRATRKRRQVGHSAEATSGADLQMELLVFDNLISAVSGKGLLNQVPEQRK